MPSTNAPGAAPAPVIHRVEGHALGPVAAASLGGGVLGSVMSPGASQVTPDQAARLSPEQVQAVVDHIAFAYDTTSASPVLSNRLATFTLTDGNGVSSAKTGVGIHVTQ